MSSKQFWNYDSSNWYNPTNGQGPVKNPPDVNFNINGTYIQREIPTLSSKYILLKPDHYPAGVNKSQTLRVCLTSRNNTDLIAYAIGLKGPDGLGVDPANPHVPQISVAKPIAPGIKVDYRGIGRDKNDNIVPQDNLCAEIPDFGADATTKSAVVVLANGKWDADVTDRLSITLAANIKPIPIKMPSVTNCSGPGCMSSMHTSMSWASDPYDSFPGQQTGSSLTESSPEVAQTNVTGFNYGITPITQGIDANGKPIVTRIQLNFSVDAWGSPGPSQSFGRGLSANHLELVSQDGIHFQVDPSASLVGAMHYDYSNYSEAVRTQYELFAGCSPTVSGKGEGLGVTGDLTLTPPAHDSNNGTATLTLDFSGGVTWRTNDSLPCDANKTDFTVTPPKVLKIYGHKQTETAPASASVTMQDMYLSYEDHAYYEP